MCQKYSFLVKPLTLQLKPSFYDWGLLFGDVCFVVFKAVGDTFIKGTVSIYWFLFTLQDLIPYCHSESSAP